jgi:hypothetical protein
MSLVSKILSIPSVIAPKKPLVTASAPILHLLQTKSLPPSVVSKITPSQQVKKTIFLDMDETLIHTHSSMKKMYVRPGLPLFLHYLSTYYEVFLYSAGVNSYVNSTAAQIEQLTKTFANKLDKESPDPKLRDALGRHLITNQSESTQNQNSRVFEEIFPREYCITVDHPLSPILPGQFDILNCMKDLSMFNRSAKNYLLLDDNPDHMLLNPNNQILIDQFTGANTDRQLLTLLPYFELLQFSKDIPSVLSKFPHQSHTDLCAEESFIRNNTDLFDLDHYLIHKDHLPLLFRSEPSAAESKDKNDSSSNFSASS